MADPPFRGIHLLIRRTLTWLGLLAAVMLAAAGGALAWLAGTQGGLEWLAARAEAALEGALVIEQPRGALAGEIRVARFAYAGEAFRVEAHGVIAGLELGALLRGVLALEPLAAQALRIELVGAAAAPPDASRDAFPALGIRIQQAAVPRLEIVRAGRVELLEDVRIPEAHLGPLGVRASASFARPDPRFPARASLEVEGRLQRMEVRATGTVAAVPFTARAEFAPSDAQPVRSLKLRAGPADAARFDPDLPRTALSAELEAAASKQGVTGTLAIANAATAPLDRGGVPVERIEARFTASERPHAVVQDLRISLAGGGTLHGRAEGGPDGLHASLRAAGVDLRSLRTTLRRTSLEGPLEVVLRPTEQSVRGTLSQDGMSLGARVVREGDTLHASELVARAQGGEARGEATLRLGQTLSVDARLRIQAFNPAAFGDFPEGAINGTLDAEGRLGDTPRVRARWDVGASTLLGHPLVSRGTGVFSAGRVAEADAGINLGPAQATVRGAWGAPADRLEWTLKVSRLDAFVPRLSGKLDAAGSLGGEWANPQIAGTARMEALSLEGEPLARSASVRATGTPARHELVLGARADGLDLEATLAGGWQAERGWDGELRTLVNRGEYPLRLAAPAPLSVAPKRVSLGRVEASLEAGRVLVREMQWEEGRLSSSGEFSSLPAQWLVLAAGANDRLRATMRLNGQWSLQSTPRLEGFVRLRRAGGDLVLLDGDELPLELNEAVLDARFDAGSLLARLDATSRYAAFALEAAVSPVEGAAGLGFGRASPLRLEGRVDATDVALIAQPFLTDARIDGRLSAQVRGTGTLGAPQLEGTVSGDGLSIEMPPYGVSLRNGTLRAALEGDHIRLTSFTIQGGGGLLEARGSLPLRQAGGAARVDWAAHRFGLLERPDRRLVVSGEGQAGFDGKRLSLSGVLRAESGYLLIERDRLPQLGSDVVIVGEPREAPAERAKVPAALDLQLDLGEQLRISAEGLEGRLGGKIQLVTTADGELRAFGRLQLVNATFRAYGQRLQVDPGVLLFDGPVDNPGLQVTAWRRNLPVEPGVQVTGTVNAPRVQLVSQPPVPEGERLSWLVLGRAPSDASKADLGLLQAAAGALLAQGRALPLDQQIARAVGLDEVSFRGSGEVQDRVLAFGKRLSDKLYVTYEQGVGAVISNLVKLDYALSRRWSLRAETGTSSGAGIFYRFSWD